MIKKGIIAITLFVVTAILSCHLCLVITYASDVQPIFKLYGEKYNSYTVVQNSGGVREVLFPYYCFCGAVSFNNGNYIFVIVPEIMLLTNGDQKGIGRRSVYRNSSGAITSATDVAFYQMTGYQSSKIINVNNNYYALRAMQVNDGTIIDTPYFDVNGNYSPDFIENIGAEMLMLYELGRINIELNNADISIDTSNIESLIKDSNTINLDIKENTSVIQADIKEIVSSSSQIGLPEETKIYYDKFYIWLVILGFLIAFSTFRTVMHQMGRNIRGRT